MLPPQPVAAMRVLALAAVLLGASGIPPAVTAAARAQPAIGPPAPASDPAPGRRSPITSPGLLRPGLFENRYAFPDLALDRRLFPELETGLITARPGFRLILDRTGFSQDAASLGQVGPQANTFEVRSVSFDIEGEFGPEKRLSYDLGIDYNGFDVDRNDSFTITDFAVSFRLSKWRAKVSLGQMREDFGYEIVGSTASMPQSERILSPFASPVNFGIKVAHQLGADDRMTLTYGLFRNDWGDGSGDLALSARLTRLVIDDPDQRRFLHAGISLRRIGSNGQLSYDATPGSRAADVFLDTGEFPASGATHVGLELQYSDGPWSVLAEHATAFVRSPETGNPRFTGFYVLGSWFVTGESRAYNRATGVVRRVTPDGRWGAVELVARYANVDLDGGSVRGGRYDRIEAGANWWATTRWKLGILAGRVWLDRFGTTGRTDTLLTRMQWVY